MNGLVRPRPRLPAALGRASLGAAFGAVLIAALAGCARRVSPAEAARRAGTLLLGNGQEPDDLDPQTYQLYTEMNILTALFEGLTSTDEATSQPVPGVAQSWEAAPDGMSYTFHLRPDARWSNGDPVTAGDFVYSFRRILSPGLGSEYSYLLYPIRNAEAFNRGRLKDFAQVGVNAPDPRTLVLRLGSPCPYLPSLAAQPPWWPVHRATIEEYGRFDQRGTAWTRPGHLVGNGPFSLEQWIPNGRVVVTRNPYYWDAARNTLRSVVFFPTEDRAADEADFRAGQVHITYSLLPDRIAAYRRADPGELRIDPFSETYYLRFNLTSPPLKDPRVRLALAEAIDRSALARDVLQGSVRPASALVPPGTAGYTSASGIPTDFAAARRLLAEAGYPGGRGFPRLEVQMWADDLNRQVMEAIQQMWRQQLGVVVSLTSLDARIYLENRRTLSFQVSFSRWIADYIDASTFLDEFLSDSGNNQTGWSDPQFDQLEREADSTMDPARRRVLMQRAEARLLGQAPIAPLYYGSRTYLIRPYVRGWIPSLLGIHRYQFVKLLP